MLLCVKGDASKSGSEIDSCARSMEDVNGSKKDLSASAGEAHTHKLYTGIQTTNMAFAALCLSQ